MNLPRQTVLLVEDLADDVVLLQRLLKKTGLSCIPHVASTGEEAIAYLDGQGQYTDREAFPLPSIIFLDLKLPGVSGFEVLTWVRQQPRFDPVQIIVLTGSRHTIDVYRAYELGANSFLVKPVDLHGLAEVVKILDKTYMDIHGPTGAMTVFQNPWPA